MPDLRFFNRPPPGAPPNDTDATFMERGPVAGSPPDALPMPYQITLGDIRDPLRSVDLGGVWQGNSQSTGYFVAAATTVFRTGIAGGGAVLPTGAGYGNYKIVNLLGSPGDVYPPEGGTILQAGAANQPVQVGATDGVANFHTADHITFVAS
ncbi:MAG TPA: hypothetical protein VGC31_11040 [Paenirhodobacter sp.]